MVGIWGNNTVRHITYYLIFNFIIIISNLLLVSIISFTHFLLDHNLGVIEEWIFDNGWQILIISKLVALLIISEFIVINFRSRDPVGEVFVDKFAWPDSKVIAIVVFLLVMITIISNPSLATNNDVPYLKLFLSFVGTISLYMFDVFLLIMLQIMFPLDNIGKITKYLLFPAIFIYTTQTTFPYAANINLFAYFNLFFCLYLSSRKVDNWSMPLFYLILFTVPVSLFLGMDMVWGDMHSIFRVAKHISSWEIVILWTIIAVYLSIDSKKYSVIR